VTRYFPEVAAAGARIDAPRFVLDGEIVVPVEGLLSLDQCTFEQVGPGARRRAAS
jgi:ATP-dependent DNA ligase